MNKDRKLTLVEKYEMDELLGTESEEVEKAIAIVKAMKDLFFYPSSQSLSGMTVDRVFLEICEAIGLGISTELSRSCTEPRLHYPEVVALVNKTLHQEER